MLSSFMETIRISDRGMSSIHSNKAADIYLGFLPQQESTTNGCDFGDQENDQDKNDDWKILMARGNTIELSQKYSQSLVAKEI